MVTQGATPLVLPARGMRRSDLSLCWGSMQVRTAAYTAPDTLRAAVATIMNMIIIWYRAACTGSGGVGAVAVIRQDGGG